MRYYSSGDIKGIFKFVFALMRSPEGTASGMLLHLRSVQRGILIVPAEETYRLFYLLEVNPCIEAGAVGPLIPYPQDRDGKSIAEAA